MNLPISDKIAFVFHGIIGGLSGRNGVGDPVDIDICAKLIKYHNKDLPVDYFIHSWSTEAEDKIVALYNPKLCSFQPQEKFNFSLTDAELKNEELTHQFRTVSRYASFTRAVDLKTQSENQQGFKYKWVVVLRLDLVLLNPFAFSMFDPSYFYIPFEPHWPNALTGTQWEMVHDVFFLSSSSNIDKYAVVGNEILNGKYNDIVHMPHVIAYHKIKELFPDMARYGGERYRDFEIYRLLMNPEQNPVGHQYGALKTKRRLEKLLKSVD